MLALVGDELRSRWLFCFRCSCLVRGTCGSYLAWAVDNNERQWDADEQEDPDMTDYILETGENEKCERESEGKLGGRGTEGPWKAEQLLFETQFSSSASSISKRNGRCKGRH